MVGWCSMGTFNDPRKTRGYPTTFQQDSTAPASRARPNSWRPSLPAAVRNGPGGCRHPPGRPGGGNGGRVGMASPKMVGKWWENDGKMLQHAIKFGWVFWKPSTISLSSLWNIFVGESTHPFSWPNISQKIEDQSIFLAPYNCNSRFG